MLVRVTSHRHKGLTLTEALVAMFVAAIGLIALMTLFPLGALQMGQALKDERTSQTAMQADGMTRILWSALVANPSGDANLWNAFDTGDGTPAPALNTFPRRVEPSYPVFVDPLGHYSVAGVNRTRVAGLANLPRRTTVHPVMPLGTNFARCFRTCSLLDDLTYNADGVATLTDPTTGTILGTPVERQGKYNWLAVVQRPDNTKTDIADLKIVVFDGRAPGYQPTGSEVSFTNVTLFPGATGLTLTYTGERPEINKGRWIMDASNIAQTDSANLRLANFYRVVSVNDETPGQLDLELQTPIKPVLNPAQNSGSYTGTIVVLTGVAEVFERPQLTR